jgi:predicted dehydrogenase
MAQISTAIIGLGRIAHGYKEYPTHLSTIKKDKRFELVSASDTKHKQRSTFQKKASNNIEMYADYRKMLKNEKIDLLIVSVPTDLHYKVCAYAIKAGIKNILCEKPITRTTSEAGKLLELANKNRVKIMVNYHRSYAKGYKKFAQLINKKKWGSVASISVQYNNGIFNTATHVIHLIEKLFGPIQKVQAIKKHSRSINDPNISFIGFYDKFNILFEGIDNINYRLLEVDMKFKKARIMFTCDRSTEFKTIDMAESMQDVYENVYQVIRNKKQPDADIKSSTRALKVAEKAVESSKTGKLITI